jgi:threonine aldolase
VLGGGMRQAGILAAAGLYALEHHVARLAEDHLNAQALAEGLRGLPGLEVEAPETNIVWVNVSAPLADRLVPALAARGVLATGTTRVRFVTHLDLSAADIGRAVAAVREVGVSTPLDVNGTVQPERSRGPL